MLCTLLYVTLTKFHALLFPCSILKWCGCVLGIGIGWVTEIGYLKLHLIFCQTCSDKNSINKNKKRKKKIWIFHSLILQIMRKFSIQHSRKTRDILDFPALEFGKNERFTTLFFYKSTIRTRNQNFENIAHH